MKQFYADIFYSVQTEADLLFFYVTQYSSTFFIVMPILFIVLNGTRYIFL